VDESGVLQVKGGKRLEGVIPVGGAKNSALALLAGSLLCPGELVLHNVPKLRDILKMFDVLESVGASVSLSDGSVVLDASQLTSGNPKPEAVQELRASFLVLGPLVARLGEATVSLPGGCAIGARPVDIHLKGLEMLGATVEVTDDGFVRATAPMSSSGSRRLQGANMRLKFPSVGATETLMMAASLAEGETVIENAAQEPEIVDLADLLNSMGARIQGAGTATMVITGVETLHPCEFTTIPDRIEAGTFLCAAAITASPLSVGPIVPAHMLPIFNTLEAMGCKVNMEGDHAVLVPAKAPLLPVDIVTLPYPGFPTDMQPQFVALLATAAGPSTVRETVFEGRMECARQMTKFGCDIKVEDSSAYIQGGAGLRGGCRVEGTDLRATAALALAGLAAEGETLVGGLKHLVRGYEGFEVKLQRVGADIRRIPDDQL